MKSTAHHDRVIDRGILTSVYKAQIKENAREMKRKSVSQIKTSLYNQHARLQSKTAAVLQVSVFAIALVAILL